MNRLARSAAIVALTLIASLPALPASAAPVTLVVSDIDPLPGQAIPVTGDGDDCPADANGAAGTFLVTLTYRNPSGTNVDVTATGAVAADGTWTSSVTLPENAVADAPASIIAAATCSGVVTASNRVNLAVLYHSGTFTLSANTVAAGGTITTTAVGCYGSEYVIVYGAAGGDPSDYDDGTSGIPETDRTFTTTMTIPVDLAPGRYDVYVLCPGTEYVETRLTVTAAAVTPSASTPVTVVPGGTTATVAPAPALIGGGFNDIAAAGTTGGGTTAGGTPVATAPVAVRGEAAFTG